MKNPHGPQAGQTDTPNALSGGDTGDLFGTEPAFFVHKALLASLSPELEKHVKNDMREGREGEMQLSEVDKETLLAFLCWAYSNSYEA